MKCNAVLLVFFLQSLSVAANAEQTVYRCGEPEHYVYSGKPCGKQSKTIRLEPKRLSSDPNPYKKLIESYKQDLEIRAKTRDKVQKPSFRGQPKTNGLSLYDFNRLRVGMSEGKVLFLVGNPDRETIDSVNTNIGLTRKSYYYIKKGFNSNVSRIIFSNGTLVDKQRELIK